MIDLHSHILPGIDDGSPDLATSIAMVEMAADSGTTHIVATPHCNSQFVFDSPTVHSLISTLQTAIDLRSPNASRRITILPGCDFHLSAHNVRLAIQDPAPFTINHRQYLLVEFSDIAIFEGAANLFDSLIRSGVRPIITHPERNAFLQKRLPDLRRWAANGCLLQITAHSYLGAFGSAAKAFAHTLTSEGLVHIVASDAHDLTRRTPRLDQAFHYLSSAFSPETATALCVDNPLSVIEGMHLSSHSATLSPSHKRPWYRFW